MSIQVHMCLKPVMNPTVSVSRISLVSIFNSRIVVALHSLWDVFWRLRCNENLICCLMGSLMRILAEVINISPQRDITFMSRVWPYVVPVFWIFDRFFADRTICVIALVVTYKIRVYHLVACGAFFQELSFYMYDTSISTYWIWRLGGQKAIDFRCTFFPCIQRI